jgi:cell division protein FtsN
MSFEENQSDMVPENIEKNRSGYTPAYCTICNKQIERYGRRKGDFKKLGWVFCPKHGWIQEGTYVKEMDIEKPLRLSIEEVQEDHNKNENPPKKDEFKILTEIETPKEFLIHERRQREVEFSSIEQPQTTDLSTKVTRNKFAFSGIIVSVIFFFVIVSFLLGYFVWKGSSKEMIEMKSKLALAHNKKMTITKDHSKVSDLSQESVSQKKSAVEVSDISASEQTGSEKEMITKSPQAQESLIAIYSVQVGAFTNIANARSLQTTLDKRGYHCYVSTQTSNGDVKLHKVLIGKFSNREKAESFSKKITKTENIRTFVTVWVSNI